MATTTPNFGWPVPTSTDYVKDGATAIEALGDAIDATVFGLGSGLSKITTNTLSNSATCVFTSLTAGARYRVVGRVIGTATGALLSRYRESSTDKATGYTAVEYGTLAGVSGFYNNNNTSISMGQIGTQAANKLLFFNFDFYIHSDSTAAYLIGQSVGADSSSANSPRYINYAGHNIVMTACNGINLFASSGNLTGSVTLYKYED
jgi:hypothetical protein